MSILDLWVPIAAVTVATFFLSFFFWAVLPHHKKDVAFCPKQDSILDFVSSSDIKTGRYMFPNCSSKKDWQKPETIETFNKGPWGVIDIWPGKPSMGRNMALTITHFLIVSIIVAYLTSLARPADRKSVV